MNHLIQKLLLLISFLCLISILLILEILSRKKTSKSLSHIIKTCSLTPAELNDAQFFLVIPNSGSSIFGAAQKGRVLWIQINMCNDICVSKEAAEYVIVVQRPVHYPELLLSAAHAENALVVMRESY